MCPSTGRRASMPTSLFTSSMWYLWMSSRRSSSTLHDGSSVSAAHNSDDSFRVNSCCCTTICYVWNSCSFRISEVKNCGKNTRYITCSSFCVVNRYDPQKVKKRGIEKNQALESISRRRSRGLLPPSVRMGFLLLQCKWSLSFRFRSFTLANFSQL